MVHGAWKGRTRAVHATWRWRAVAPGRSRCDSGEWCGQGWVWRIAFRASVMSCHADAGGAARRRHEVNTATPAACRRTLAVPWYGPFRAILLPGPCTAGGRPRGWWHCARDGPPLFNDPSTSTQGHRSRRLRKETPPAVTQASTEREWHQVQLLLGPLLGGTDRLDELLFVPGGGLWTSTSAAPAPVQQRWPPGCPSPARA